MSLIVGVFHDPDPVLCSVDPSARISDSTPLLVTMTTLYFYREMKKRTGQVELFKNIKALWC